LQDAKQATTNASTRRDELNASMAEAQDNLEALDSQLAETRASRGADLSTVELALQRIQKLSDMWQALKCAREDAVSEHNTCARLDVATEAIEQEEDIREELSEKLIECVSATSVVEVECNMWKAEKQRLRTFLKTLQTEHQELRDRYASLQSEKKTVEATIDWLQSSLLEARETKVVLELKLQQLQTGSCKASNEIDQHKRHMKVLGSSYEGEVGCLLPTLTETRQRKQQADNLHSERLTQIKECTSGRVRLVQGDASLNNSRPASASAKCPFFKTRDMYHPPHIDDQLDDLIGTTAKLTMAGRMLVGQIPLPTS